MSQFNGSARLKMAQLGWLSHFEPSRGITRWAVVRTAQDSTSIIMPVHDALLLYRPLLVAAARTLFVTALALSALPVIYITYVLILAQIRAYRSPIRNVPGPKKAHWLKGNFVDVQEPDSSRLQEEWVKTYGHVTRYYSLFGVRSYPFHLF